MSKSKRTVGNMPPVCEKLVWADGRVMVYSEGYKMPDEEMFIVVHLRK